MWGLVFYNNAVRLAICEGWHFIITLFAWLYVRVGILLTCGKHLHNFIISLTWEVWAHITSFTFFYWSVYAMSGKWVVVYLCVKGMNFASFYDFDIWFWNGSSSVVFLVLHFIPCDFSFANVIRMCDITTFVYNNL